MVDMVCCLPKCDNPDVFCVDCQYYKGLFDPRVYKLIPIDEEFEPKQEPEPWTRQRVLREAEKCVCGEREQDYGTPDDNFGRIAEFWTTYMGVEFNTVDVAIMMALLKIARLANNQEHMDSWVDLAGYAACGGEIAGREP